MRAILKRLCYGLIATLFMTLAHARSDVHLGKINFSTSGNKHAQSYFEAGVMLLHSFEYQDARNAFQQAEKIDPSFALAYWGEAMTYNHPLWQEQDLNAARAALDKLAPTPIARAEKAKTAKEKGLINAINLLYGPGDKKFRDTAYANAMQQLYRQYKNDDEIASFYALALLGATEGERNLQIYLKAATIAETVYKHNPQHPGATHYIIHSYDDPKNAARGLNAAHSYAKTAPDASHALHMPSHIYLAMGLWNDVIAANKTAWQAGLKHNPNYIPAAFTLDDLHALQWLSYGYLQKQQYLIAYCLTKTMESIAINTQTPMAKWYYTMIRGAYISASHDYHHHLATLDMNGTELSAQITNLYTNAIIALNNKDMKTAQSILKQIITLIPTPAAAHKTYPDYFTSITTTSIAIAKIMRLELAGQIAIHAGQLSAGIQLLQQAATLENTLSFGYGPPQPIEPSFELLAAALMQKHDYAAAITQYQLALKRMPNRIESLKGIEVARQRISE